MTDRNSPLARSLIEEGIKRPVRDPLIADLKRIADGFNFTATRMGAPGCAARLRAAEDEATVRAAILLLSPERTQP